MQRKEGKTVWPKQIHCTKQEARYDGELPTLNIAYLQMANGSCQQRDQCLITETKHWTKIFSKDEGRAMDFLFLIFQFVSSWLRRELYITKHVLKRNEFLFLFHVYIRGVVKNANVSTINYCRQGNETVNEHGISFQKSGIYLHTSRLTKMRRWLFS